MNYEHLETTWIIRLLEVDGTSISIPFFSSMRMTY